MLVPRLLLLLLLAGLAPAATAQPVAPGTRVDGIAAVVGEGVVLTSEVDALAQQSAAAAQQPVTPELWSRALDQLVDRRVLVEAIRRDTTITVTEDQISSEVDRQMAGLIQQAGGEDALVAAYGRPLADLREQFREDTRDELMLQQARGRRFRSVGITPGEVREWFERIPMEQRTMVPELVRVAHVARIARPDDAAKARARLFAQALRDSVVAGQATIEAVADRHTQDPGNVNRDGTRNGGRYDTFRLRDLEPTFRAALGALAPGQLSQVVETPFGFHVMRLNAITGEAVSFNHVLIPAQATSTPDELRADLAVLRDSVVTHGVPFEAIARRHSDDAMSSMRGGIVSDPQTGERDLAVEALASLDPRWGATIRGLQEGEISQPAPVRLLDGSEAVHFVLLQRRTPTHRLSFETDYALLSQYALNEKRQRLASEWVAELRPSVHVEVRASQYVAR